MMGDVPVGVFLSGGLDSSLVAAIAARWAAREGTVLHTFAVGTDGSPDLAAARTVAEFLGTDHHEIDYRAAEALESLPNVVRAIESFDPGLVRSAVPNYMLARMTRQHVRVVLTGEGADELFAGYDYLREFTEPDALRTEEVFAAVQTTPMGGPIALTWTNPPGNVFGVLFGFAHFHGAENPEIQAAAGAYGAAAGSGDEEAQAAALTDLNTAVVESGWLLPLFEQLSPWAYDKSSVQEPTFPGTDSFPILSTLQPAS